MAGFTYPEIDSTFKISDFPYLFETHLKSNIEILVYGMWILYCLTKNLWNVFYWIWFWESQACCKVITLTAQSVCLVRKKVVRIYLAINNAITCTTDVILNKHDLRTLLKYSIACGNTFHESYPILTPVSKLIFVKIRKFTKWYISLENQLFCNLFLCFSCLFTIAWCLEINYHKQNSFGNNNILVKCNSARLSSDCFDYHSRQPFGLPLDLALFGSTHTFDLSVWVLAPQYFSQFH